MTNEEFVFNQTAKERKSAGTGAFHKKNGAKSKHCTLPSDYLTPAQKKKLNGPTVTWQMNSFYSYPEFKAMPDDIQEAYLVTIVKKYKVGITTIANTLFGVTGPALYAYISKKEYYRRLINITEKHSLAENINNFKTAISLSLCKDGKITMDAIAPEKQNEIEIINDHGHLEVEASLSFTELISFASTMASMLNTNKCSDFSDKKIKMKLIIDAVD